MTSICSWTKLEKLTGRPAEFCVIKVEPDLKIQYGLQAILDGGAE